MPYLTFNSPSFRGWKFVRLLWCRRRGDGDERKSAVSGGVAGIGVGPPLAAPPRCDEAWTDVAWRGEGSGDGDDSALQEQARQEREGRRQEEGWQSGRKGR